MRLFLVVEIADKLKELTELKYSFLLQMENSGVVHMLKHSKYEGSFFFSLFQLTNLFCKSLVINIREKRDMIKHG